MTDGASPITVSAQVNVFSHERMAIATFLRLRTSVWAQVRTPHILGMRDDLKVSRIDDQGAFVFAGGATGIFRLRRRAQAEMIFSYRDQAIKCRGIPIRSLEERSGSAVAIGFQFRGMSPDARKELGDFVETLRGEGHV